MSERQHLIARYAYVLEAGTGFGRISLWDAGENLIGEIGFLEEGRSAPNPKLANDLSHGIGFLPTSRMTALIDMLRNEEAVYLALSDEPPGFFSVHTTSRQKSFSESQTGG